MNYHYKEKKKQVRYFKPFWEKNVLNVLDELTSNKICQVET